MDVYYYGANSIQVVSKEFNVLVDPFLYGAALPKSTFKQTPIVLLTQEWQGLKLPDGSFVIDAPGEYEISGLTIRGVAIRLHIDDDTAPRRGVAYKVIGKDHTFGFFGHTSNNLDESVLEEFGLLDLVTLPVGGNGYTLDVQSASSIIKEIDPKIIVPTHFKDDNIHYPVPQDGVDELGGALNTSPEHEDSLKIKGVISDSGLRAVVLRPRI